MTKKTKEATIELKPIEIVEKVLDTLVTSGKDDIPATSFDMDEQDIPFLKAKPVLEGKRPYRVHPNSEPVVEIAGKRFELKDVDKKDVPVHLSAIIPSYYDTDNILSHTRRSHHGSSGNWHQHQKLKADELKFKHVRVDGMDIYISTGSKLVVSDSLYSDYHEDHSPFINGGKSEKPTLVIVASTLESKTLSFMGKSVLFNSLIQTNCGGVSLIDASVIHSSVVAVNQYITIDDSSIESTELRAANYITISDSAVYGPHITGLGSITLTKVNGGGDFNIATYGDGSKEIELLIDNQYIHRFDFSNSHIPRANDYVPALDFPIHYGRNVVTINKRIDYGMFSAMKPIPFLRMNQCDLLVGDQIFSVKDFFPEFVTEKEPVVSSGGQYGYQPPTSFGPFSIGLAGHYNRETELWKRAAKIAFGKPKAVIGKSGEVLVNGLLDQIKSRINLYVELSSVMG